MQTDPQAHNEETSQEERDQALLDYLHAIEPWIQLKIRVISSGIPKYRVDERGFIELVGYDEATSRVMKECDCLIERIRKRVLVVKRGNAEELGIA